MNTTMQVKGMWSACTNMSETTCGQQKKRTQMYRGINGKSKVD